MVMIRFEKLRKEFDSLVAVNDLDIEIPEGEIYGLIGPNGAGKTTTFRMACGLLKPTGGRAFIHGMDVHQHPEQVQQFIGYLSDFFGLYEDLDVWEYLDCFAHAYKMPESEIPARIDEVIHLVGLEVKRDAMIKGLSRGMNQRLGIGRAIIHRPRVLLLDEPAAGLDPRARHDLRDLLRSLRDQGTTIVISSHILTELEGFCTSIGLMERGRLVHGGKIEEIAGTEGRTKTVRLRWLGDAAGLVRSALSAKAGVSGLMVKGSEGVFEFSGGEEHLAQMLGELITGGVRIVSFDEVKVTVEDLYMKLSRHEVS